MGADDAAKAPAMTEAEAERLLSDPRIRELQYKLRSGAEKFKLEVTNEKPQEVAQPRSRWRQVAAGLACI
jgi:hypothetical protein